MKLYTTLVRAKQAISLGHLPPMMELTPEAKAVFDPRFVPGLGGLEEDEEKGLRCPVRGCGNYYQHLGTHLKVHGITARQFRKLLSIANNVPLATGTICRVHRAAAPKRGTTWKRALRNARRSPRSETKAAYRSVGFLNLRDKCNAQVAHKLLDLEHKLGRVPNAAEAMKAYGAGFVDACERLYGSWANAQTAVLEKRSASNKFRPTFEHKEDVIAAMKVFLDAHGRLPTAVERGVLPFTPAVPTVEKIFKCRWSAAIESIAHFFQLVPVRARPHLAPRWVKPELANQPQPKINRQPSQRSKNWRRRETA